MLGHLRLLPGRFRLENKPFLEELCQPSLLS